MVQKWAITEKVPGRCVNSDPAITRRNLERHVMQFKQNTIQILDAHGQVITTMVLPANFKLAQLAPLKFLGDISVRVLPGAPAFIGLSVGGVQ